MSNVSNEPNLIAIDLGNGTTSYIAGNGKRGSFPSLVSPYKDTSGLGSDYAKEVFRTKDGKTFLVGESCRDANAQSRSTDSSFYSSDTIHILLLKVLEECDIKTPIIVTGLPTEFYDKEIKGFEDNIRRWAKGEGYQLKHVKVVPQWAGPWFDDQLEDEQGVRVPLDQVLKGKWGIIDIGQGTTDIGQFNNGRVSDQRYGESKGVSDIHRAVFTTLKSNPDSIVQDGKRIAYLPKEFELDKQTTEHTADKWFRDGHISWRGKKLDMGIIGLPARNEFAKDVLPRCIEKVWGSTDFLDGMIVAGGGATVLGMEVFKQYVHCPIFKAATPELSIVRGFYRFAKTQILPKIDL
ncbi:ParM/StbA family protein [Pseudomonas syringae pv. actinidiae]|nr:ParM/StbA family protein [Pseudomonas syringae pv. actinidiae]